MVAWCVHQTCMIMRLRGYCDFWNISSKNCLWNSSIRKHCRNHGSKFQSTSRNSNHFRPVPVVTEPEFGYNSILNDCCHKGGGIEKRTCSYFTRQDSAKQRQQNIKWEKWRHQIIQINQIEGFAWEQQKLSIWRGKSKAMKGNSSLREKSPAWWEINWLLELPCLRWRWFQGLIGVAVECLFGELKPKLGAFADVCCKGCLVD